MFSQTKNPEKIDSEQREQYEYARKRVNQKKNLMRHFVIFLAGSILFIVLDEFLKVGEDRLGNGWYVWAILIWAFILLIHVLNVFVMNTFMGKEWENKQLEKLKIRQAEKMVELQKKVDAELPLPTSRFESQQNSLNNPLPPDKK